VIIEEIPHHLRNTVTHVDCPIYLGLDGDVCRPPAPLALGDTLMLLGLLRNHGRPVRLHLDPGPLAGLVQGHPMVAELAPPDTAAPAAVRQVAVRRFGRDVSWYSEVVQRVKFGVAPVDHIRLNPIVGHSLHHKLGSLNDRPGIFLDPARPAGLQHLLSRQKPTVVVYPINPSRSDPFWADHKWWAALLANLRPSFALVALGAPDYGEITDLVDCAVPSDAPDSRLEDLAALIKSAAGFVGVDGGLSHLAAAVNTNLVTVWDAMTSFRHWAGGIGHHIVMSNPHGFRYPQSRRLDLDDLKKHFRRVKIPDGRGGHRLVELPQEGFKDACREIFGSVAQYAMSVQALREVREERGCVAAWMNNPAQKELFYSQSLGLAYKALAGQAPRGANWVAPVTP